MRTRRALLMVQGLHVTLDVPQHRIWLASSHADSEALRQRTKQIHRLGARLMHHPRHQLVALGGQHALQLSKRGGFTTADVAGKHGEAKHFVRYMVEVVERLFMLGGGEKEFRAWRLPEGGRPVG